MIASLALVLCSFILFPHESEARGSGTDSGKATVKDGPLQVHEDPSVQSKVVKSLSKGAAVTVEIEMHASDGAWCGVSEQGMSSLTGYVPCDSLEKRKKAPVAWKFIGSKGAANSPGRPAGRSVSAPEKPKRPYSDITALLYMTTW